MSLEPTDPWGGPAPEPEPEYELTTDDFEVPEGYRAGFVAIIGRPNVGKSTLVNAILGERLAPTSPVPQTTRRRLLGILSRDDAQVVFVDTPGVHRPSQRLGEVMVDQARQALVDADLVLYVVDATRAPGEEDDLALSIVRSAEAAKYLVVNKLDLAEGEGFRAQFEHLAPLDGAYGVSAVSGQGLDELVEAIVAALPESPPYFPPDQLTDVYEREIGAELIREAALTALHKELPHAIAVKVEEWKERDNGVLYLRAFVIVERESQKGIVIGQGGRMLKTIGSRAREKLEDWLDQRVYLDLQVKVLKDWRKDESALRHLGFFRD